MKRTINYSLILSLLFVLVVIPVSCSKESAKENPQSDINLPIKISGEQASEDTKTTLNGVVTSWIETTDKVGIYSTQARTATSGGGSEVVNAEFTAASSGVSSSFNGTMFWGAANASHTFNAYYPYASGSPAATAVPVSLPAAQTQSAANSTAHIGALDFMVATPVTVTSPANTNAVANEVNLKYNHLFTVLEFQIKGTGQLKAVKLSANTTLAFSGGTIDITQSTPATDVAYAFASQTGTSGEAVVTLTDAAILTATNADTKVYMVINPGTPTGNCTIRLSSDGVNYLTISKEAPSGGFVRGKKYVVAIDKATAVSTVPDAPIIGTATMGDAQARVTFTASNNGGSEITSYTATSSPGGLTGTGTASSITVTGLTNGTAYTFTVTATNTIGTSVPSSASNSITPAGIPVVTNPTTGKTWMDRNLGASRVATSSTDAQAYGDLYQWGRAADGHQIRTSGTTSTLSSTDVPGHANFILASSDWRSPQNSNLWQGETGTNNPCPSGFRIPTEAELTAEINTWTELSGVGAFGSLLKLPLAGLRINNTGSIDSVDSWGDYWSSDTPMSGNARTLYFRAWYTNGLLWNNFARARGQSVRCIKD
jgi:uncharacterized protein (TIGR02145 family)